METKQFHLGDVLSVVVNVLVSRRRLVGTNILLEFMVKDNRFKEHPLFSKPIMSMCQMCLLMQFPQLATGEIASVANELTSKLESRTADEDQEEIIEKWLAEQVAKYGETLMVKPLPIVIGDY